MLALMTAAEVTEHLEKCNRNGTQVPTHTWPTRQQASLTHIESSVLTPGTVIHPRSQFAHQKTPRIVFTRQGFQFVLTAFKFHTRCNNPLKLDNQLQIDLLFPHCQNKEEKYTPFSWKIYLAWCHVVCFIVPSWQLTGQVLLWNLMEPWQKKKRIWAEAIKK